MNFATLFPEELLAASIETVSVQVGGRRESGVIKTEHACFFLGKHPGPCFDWNDGSEGRWAPSPYRSEGRGSVQPLVQKQPNGQRDLTLLMRHCLTRCLLEHERCSRRTGNQEDMFLPTRLINVGTTSEPCLNLALSADLPRSRRSQYITLSYCWGSEGHSALTTALNLGERYQHIDMECLPKTFQDAIEISRQLKILYIWIDAICIIQPTVDDFGDWEAEIPLMGKVYRNSTCTIAASGAQSSDGGCFTRRDAAKLPMSTFMLRDNTADPTRKGLINFKPKIPTWSIAVENSPLSKRAWVLQERMMTSRTLFWTRDALFWGCAESHASEFESICSGTDNDLPNLEDVIESMHDHSSLRRQERKSWIDILEEYSKKQLTNLANKLPALRGIASEIAAARPDQEYLDGMWRSNLVEELAWAADYTIMWNVFDLYAKVEPPISRLSSHPTWSWASMHFGLCFRPGRRAMVHTELVDIEIGPVTTQDAVSAQGNNLRTLTSRGILDRLHLRKTRNVKLSVLGGELEPGPCIFEPWEVQINSRDLKHRSEEVVLIDTKEDLKFIQKK